MQFDTEDKVDRHQSSNYHSPFSRLLEATVPHNPYLVQNVPVGGMAGIQLSNSPCFPKGKIHIPKYGSFGKEIPGCTHS